jgi:hypothetical protein
MADRPDRDLWAPFRDLVTFAFTVATGAASLGGWSPTTGRLALRGIAVLGGLYIVFRLGNLYRASRLTDQRDQRMTEIFDAITRVCDRQAPSHEEEVTLTVTIGRTDEEDTILQEFSTKPTPQLVQRLIRPITPLHQKGRPSLSDMNFTCEVDNGSGPPVRVTSLPIDTSTPWRVWLIFEPAITSLRKWHIRYQQRGMWRPLRKDHRDTLVWNDRVPHDGRSPMTDFKVRFVFLDSRYRPNVVEQSGLGTTSALTRGTQGEWVIEWHDPAPRGHRYKWEIVRVEHHAS